MASVSNWSKVATCRVPNDQEKILVFAETFLLGFYTRLVYRGIVKICHTIKIVVNFDNATHEICGWGCHMA